MDIAEHEQNNVMMANESFNSLRYDTNEQDKTHNIIIVLLLLQLAHWKQYLYHELKVNVVNPYIRMYAVYMVHDIVCIMCFCDRLQMHLYNIIILC